jgi:hypothetical protein
MSYDSITNRGDYLSPHYLAEVLPRDLAKKTSLRTRWAERDKAGEPTPVKGLRNLRRAYFDARLSLKDTAADAQLRAREADELTELRKLNGRVLSALGFTPAPAALSVERGGEPFEVAVTYYGQNVLAVDCDWATDTDAAFNPDGGGRLLRPLELTGREKVETGAKLARLLFASELASTGEPPRYVLLLHGGVIVLADRLTWGEGRYLAVSLDAALERADAAELELIAALFSSDALQPPAEGGEEPLAAFVSGSRQHAVGVSAELREGLRESVQIIANEVLDRLRDQGVDDPATVYDGNLAKDLGRQSLRYLYRILFLLYAEARPELGILPVDDEDYAAGYSMARLGDLVARRLIGGDANAGFHLYESLAVLFRMVNDGHDNPGDGEGLQFEALQADLFDSGRTKLIGELVDPSADSDGLSADSDGPETPPGPRTYDTRLRDGALYQVLRRLMLSKGGGAGRGRGRGRTERGGFISYAQLGISQLGAVYEGLMSYTGFIAAEVLYEVAKNGDPAGGSWMIPASKIDNYADDVFVKEKDENGFQTGERVRYAPGSFVYRLAGRDRQTSASYYTPQSLTSVTVQLALEQRVKEQEGAEGGTKVTPDEVLRWRICEPALGSGAFLNEAIDQTAALYLKLREQETNERLEPEERALALQRVKAYIALHNCYGVDLNETAVELAEVSIWLNVMHRGLQAPWFGLHLVRGNSLIGAGRRLYPAHALAKGEWLKTAPVDHPFSAGEIPSGHVHHFLLPAAGWGAVAGEKEAKELAPDDAARLAKWRRQLQKSPSDRRTAGHKQTQVQRLQALSARAEYLWDLVIKRLRISEREISRPISVWGAHDLPHALETIPRDQIVDELTLPGTPYWRLKTVMDAWCALWFWPLDKADLLDGSSEVYKNTSPAITPQPEPKPEPAPVDPDPNFPVVWEMDSLFGETPKQLTLAEAAPRQPRPKPKPTPQRSPVPLANLDDWLDFAEALLGRQDIKAGTLGRTFDNLTDLSAYEIEIEDAFHLDMDPVYRLGERFPWLNTVHQIAAAQGFFHWELRFASVFADGGFDLQVGNPPWVRPRWEETPVLAEYDPWFELADKPPVPEQNHRKTNLLAVPRQRRYFLQELTQQVGTRTFFSSIATYDLLSGTQPDLYRAFMIRTWRSIGRSGTVGLLHPDTHLVGDAERFLRAASYRRLRLHGDFVNSGNRFFPPPVNRSSHFGMHIYGLPKQIRFAHLSWLLSAVEFPQSLALAEAGKLPDSWDSEGSLPSVKYRGEWDSRAHPARVVWIDSEMLATWQRASGSEQQSVEYTRLLNPVSAAEQGAILAFAEIQERLGKFGPRISRGYDESSAKKSGFIVWRLHDPNSWSEIILKGPQIGVATPFYKQPPETGTKGRPQDLTALPSDALPRSEYARSIEMDTYIREQDRWISQREFDEIRLMGPVVNSSDIDIARHPYTEFYRVMWREMIPDDTDRSLFPALYPPGPAHIHGVRSMSMKSDMETALVAGFWAGLPIDYLLRVTKTEHFDVTNVRLMPDVSPDHQLAGALLLRALRLNCLTTAYASLWEELYNDPWCDESWEVDWPSIEPLGAVGRRWEHPTPLRTEYERRAALVEIDALVAVWLGITEEQLEAIYPARYPVLADYEEVTWFDANGRKIAGNWNTYGTGQTKEHWEQFEKYLEDPERNPVPDGYTAPFYKADRIAEYRQAHAAFSARLAEATRLGAPGQHSEGNR